MFVTKWFFVTCLTIQVKAQTDAQADAFTEFLVDEALKSLRDIVDDPTVIPIVGDQMMTEISTDFGSVKLENGKLSGLKTFERSGPVGGITIDEDNKAMFAAFIGVGEARVNYDAIATTIEELTGISEEPTGISEESTVISVKITDLQILLLAEMDFSPSCILNCWKVLDFQIIPDWPTTAISVEGDSMDAVDFVKINLMDINGPMITNVEPSLMKKFQESLNLLDSDLILEFLIPDLIVEEVV